MVGVKPSALRVCALQVLVWLGPLPGSIGRPQTRARACFMFSSIYPRACTMYGSMGVYSYAGCDVGRRFTDGLPRTPTDCSPHARRMCTYVLRRN